MQIDLSTILMIVLPSLIVGLVAYYIFNSFLQNEENRRAFLLRRESHKETLPLRLQAFERMTLFLERIDPGSLLVRVQPNNNDKHKYEEQLIQAIEQEFKHNLTQQIYITDECWNAIRATKNATISLIRKSNMHEEVDSPAKLRETILTELLDKSSPSKTGLAYLKKEAKMLW